MTSWNQEGIFTSLDIKENKNNVFSLDVGNITFM